MDKTRQVTREGKHYGKWICRSCQCEKFQRIRHRRVCAHCGDTNRG